MTTGTRVTLLLLLSSVTLLGIQTCRLDRAGKRADSNAARADSIAAVNDTTRVISGRALTALQKLYGDSVRGFERRVLQLQPQKDALDRALERSTTANATLTARVRELEANATSSGSVTTTPEGDRKADFHVRQEPYTVGASVTLPASGPGRMAVRVALDSATIRPRLQCGQPVGGYSPASVILTTPDWLSVRVDSVQQSPDICNPPPRRRWYDGRLTIGPSVNVTFVKDTAAAGGYRPNFGFGVSGQLSLWRWP